MRVYGAVPVGVRLAEGFWAHTEPPGLESQNVHHDFHKNVHLDFQFSPLKPEPHGSRWASAGNTAEVEAGMLFVAWCYCCSGKGGNSIKLHAGERKLLPSLQFCVKSVVWPSGLVGDVQALVGAPLPTLQKHHGSECSAAIQLLIHRPSSSTVSCLRTVAA